MIGSSAYLTGVTHGFVAAGVQTVLLVAAYYSGRYRRDEVGR